MTSKQNAWMGLYFELREITKGQIKDKLLILTNLVLATLVQRVRSGFEKLSGDDSDLRFATE